MQAQVQAKIDKEKAKLEAVQRELHMLKAQQRAYAQQERHKRLFALGCLVEQAGLLYADDTKLLKALEALATLWQEQERFEA
jgi:hypothetical protein